MNNIVIWLRSLLDRIEDFDAPAKIRILKRSNKRKLALGLFIFIFLIYVFSSDNTTEKTSAVQQCLNDRLQFWSSKFDDIDIGIDHSSVSFVGNGHIGVDSSGELRFSSNGSRYLDLQAKFYPFTDVSFSAFKEVKESVVTDFEDGIWRKMSCFSLNGECACVVRSYIAHRIRRNLLIEEIQIINPTKSSISLDLSRPSVQSPWIANKTGSAVIFHRSLNGTNNVGIVASAICSNSPGTVNISPKREETLRIVCVFDYKTVGDDVEKTKEELSADVANTFSVVNSETNQDVLKEHTTAWNEIHSSSFYLSHSKAPGVLNSDKINATKYVILSNTRTSTKGDDSDFLNSNHKQLPASVDRCYSGHSTLLYPSRLWQADMSTTTPQELVKLADLWILTLEKKGCGNLVKSGIRGLSQAFVLSLLACSFHDGHLEMDMAASDLHRDMSVRGISVGGGGSTVNIHVVVHTDNRPYLEVSASDTLYACDGGCLDVPVTLSKSLVRLPIKVTKPRTSILYVATNRKHLKQLRSAIHVSEVEQAPAHEEDVLSLHRHGSKLGGLPTSFWVFLGVLLIAFHVFLAKMLWSEWRKGDMTPYNPYLRNRYSSVRSH